jgi:FkbM family methyltransferase
VKFIKLYRLLKALFKLLNVKRIRVFLATSEMTNFDHEFTVSYSQGGEDLALLSNLSQVIKGTYIDVGAHHPDRFSVTRHLYQRGWRGVNIEANPWLMAEFEKRRPRDINLNLAVGGRSSYEFTIFSEPALSTYNNSWKENFIKGGAGVRKVIKIQGITLRQIIDKYFPNSAPTLLNIDAEGSDLEVLHSIDFNSLESIRFPSWIMVETREGKIYNLDSPEVRYLESFGYKMINLLPMSSLLRYIPELT